MNRADRFKNDPYLRWPFFHLASQNDSNLSIGRYYQPIDDVEAIGLKTRVRRTNDISKWTI